MLFVELGREVSPVNLKYREHKAIITGIKDNKFVVILKQDKTYEVVRLKELVLNDRVYDLEEVKNPAHEFYSSVPVTKKSTDFERFVVGLAKRAEDEVINSKLNKN